MFTKRPFILFGVLIFATWLLLLSAYFVLAAVEKQNIWFSILALLSVVAAMVAVLVAQSSSSKLFYSSILSLVAALLIVISPFLSFLKPVRIGVVATVNGISRAVIGKTPYDWLHPVKSVEEWMMLAKNLPTGTTLNFKIFPNIPEWNRVCIFLGHSTDAQFNSVVQLELPWKLSDKSKSTTHKEYAAIAFVDDSAKNVVHIFDIAQSEIDFDAKLNRSCMKYSKSILKRVKEPSEGIGPVFVK